MPLLLLLSKEHVLKKSRFGSLKEQLASLFAKPVGSKFIDNYVKTFINVPEIETTHKLHIVGDK